MAIHRAFPIAETCAQLMRSHATDTSALEPNIRSVKSRDGRGRPTLARYPPGSADRTVTAINKKVSLGFCSYARQCRPPRTKLHPSTLASSKCRDREWTSGAPEQLGRAQNRYRSPHPHLESPSRLLRLHGSALR